MQTAKPIKHLLYTLIRLVETDRLDGVTITHVWFAPLFWALIFLQCGLAFLLAPPMAGFAFAVFLIVALFLVTLCHNFRIARIDWGSGKEGRVFALKNTFDFLKEDFEMVVFPGEKAALIQHGLDPMHELILVLPSERSVSLWRDIRFQVIIGNGTQFRSCRGGYGRVLLKELIDDLSDADRAELQRRIEGTCYLKNAFRKREPNMFGSSSVAGLTSITIAPELQNDGAGGSEDFP